MIRCLLLLSTLSLGCGGASSGPTTPPASPPGPSAGVVAQPEAAAPEYSITNLYDSFGRDREGVTHDFGFSALVRYGDLTILFDGGSDQAVFERNVEALGVDLRTIDIAILSHNHVDHMAGIHSVIAANPDVQVFLPADGFLGGWFPFNYMGNAEAIEALPPEERYRPHASGRVGFEGSGPYNGANLEYVGEHREIAPGVRLVTTRADLMGYFVAYPPHEDDPQHLPLPELTLALDTANDQVLVVGCSHSTVESIVRVAREQDARPIELLMGGYHLLPYPEDYLRALAGRLSEEHGVQRVAPSHCTGPLATRILREAFGDAYALGGLGERIVYRD